MDEIDSKALELLRKWSDEWPHWKFTEPQHEALRALFAERDGLTSKLAALEAALSDANKKVEELTRELSEYDSANRDIVKRADFLKTERDALAADNAVKDEALLRMVSLYESEYDADAPFDKPDWLLAALSNQSTASLKVDALEANDANVEALAEFLCSEFDFDLNPCVGYSWPQHPNDDGYRGDRTYVHLQPKDVQAHARDNARRVLLFLSQRARESRPAEGQGESVKFENGDEQDPAGRIAACAASKGGRGMSLPRFIFEFKTPALKCERVDHRVRIETRSGYTDSKTSWRSVADAVEQKREICRRCGLVLKGWYETERYSLQGLSMSADDFKILNRDGEIWLRGDGI